jgi:uncharacterized protein (TIGR02231 family)
MSMLRFLVVAVSAAAMCWSAYGQESSPVSSSISEVTVYPDRARVTRTAMASLPMGTSVLEFSGLPAALDESSIEVSAKGDAPLTIEGIDVRQEFLASSASPKAQDLERQLQELQDQEKSLQGQKDVCKEKREFFRNLSAGLAKGDKGPINLDDVRKLYTFYGEEISNLSGNILSIERSETKLAPEIDRVKRELDALRNAAQKSQRTLLVSVKAGAAARGEFTLRYLIGNASWISSYNARIDSGTGKVELLYNALVRQKTGEDWNNVRLALSTAQPGRNGRMPELMPSYVDYRAPEPVASARAEFAQAVPMPAPNEPPRAKEELVQSDEAQAEVEKSGMSVSYQVGLPVTIPADGQAHRANVTVLNLAGSPEYVTTPKLDSAVFLKVHLVNTSDAQLLPGQVSVFRDGEFTGMLTMNLAPSGSDFDLYAGKDDSIKVERKELVSKRSETGILNRREVEDRRYQISLQNFRSSPIKLTVNDQLPVSKNADIAVNQGAFSDKPTAIDKDTGKLSWDFELQPKVKKVIEFNYSVEWPKGKEIVGGT